MVPGEDMSQVTYFCVAHGGDKHGWQAICLNVDVAVEGRTLADVKARLMEAVDSYVEAAMALPPADREKLLRRSVPFSMKLKHAFKLFWRSLRSGSRDGGRERASFEIPCHA